jgi:hypothetical protein
MDVPEGDVNGFVPQQFLKLTYVHALLQLQGCKSVPKGVSGHSILCDRRAFNGSLEFLSEIGLIQGLVEFGTTEQILRFYF